MKEQPKSDRAIEKRVCFACVYRYESIAARYTALQYVTPRLQILYSSSFCISTSSHMRYDWPRYSECYGKVAGWDAPCPVFELVQRLKPHHVLRFLVVVSRNISSPRPSPSVNEYRFFATKTGVYQWDLVEAMSDHCMIYMPSRRMKHGIDTVSYTHLTLPTKRIV